MRQRRREGERNRHHEGKAGEQEPAFSYPFGPKNRNYSTLKGMRSIVFILLFAIMTVSCTRRGSSVRPPMQRHKETVTVNQPQRPGSSRRPVQTRPSQSNPPASSASPELESPAQTGGNIAGGHRILSGEEIFQRYNTAVFMVYTSNGHVGAQGSGFFVSSDGVAVSNHHVFKGSRSGHQTVELASGERFSVGRILAQSETNDFIVFQVALNGRTVNYIPIASEVPKVGEKVYAIGSPKGFKNTFASGEISQIREDNELQISVPIDHGSSGGALINSRGEVIGITTSGVGDSKANLNFAKSIELVKPYLP